MKNFKIRINELHKREINIQAKNSDEAVSMIEKLYESKKVDSYDSSLVSYSIQNEAEINSKDILIKEVISYLYEDEKKHYEEFDDEKPTDHIFLKLEKLSEIIN
jgi:hypothetical protein